ncbi:SMI1/KNR4 family protein [Lysobacter sp. HA35]
MEADSIAAVVESARSRGIDVYIGEPASVASIQRLEEQIGQPLPSSVRAYLQEFGCVSLADVHLSGIIGNDPCAPEGGNIIFDTAQLKASLPELPESHWVVLLHEDGGYCMDYSVCRAGEPRIVNVERGTTSTVAESFSVFVANYLRVLAT